MIYTIHLYSGDKKNIDCYECNKDDNQEGNFSPFGTKQELYIAN